MKHKKGFDAFKEKVNCVSCLDKKPLDCMLLKDSDKKEYECIDCKVENYKSDSKEIIKVFDFSDLKIEESKLGALMRWCFG